MELKKSDPIPSTATYGLWSPQQLWSVGTNYFNCEH